MIPMRTAKRLWNNLIDNAQLDQVFARKPQGPCGLVSVPRTLPEDSGASFGADYGVIREFENGNMVAHPNTKRSS